MNKIFLVSNTDWYLYRFRLSLGKDLLEYGMEPVFISPFGKYVEKIRAAGIRWLEWNVERRSYFPSQELISVFRFMNLLRVEKPALIHNHTIKPVFYGSLSARLVHFPNVVNSITGRGYLFLGNTLSLRITRKIVIPVYRFVTDNPNYVTIFENQDDLGYFKSFGSFSHTHNVIIPGVGVDIHYYQPTPEPNEIPVIAYVGRLLWDKGVQTFVEAAKVLKQKGIKVRMVLIGSTDPGNPTSIPEKIIHHWVQSGDVEWWGWQEEMPQVYKQCNIIVIPSLGEGLSTTLLEAMASKRAVIATDVPGCRDVIQDKGTGILVPPNEPIAIADAITKLINSPNLRYQFATAGRLLIEKLYTTQHINQLTLQTYREILGRK